MEFERSEMWPVSGFKEPQKMEVALITDPGADEFHVRMEGDTIIDDGWMDYASFGFGLNVGEALKLYGELHRWLTDHGVHFSQIVLATTPPFIPSPEELDELRRNEQDAGS